MGRKYFGTDGVRGRANVFPMTPEVAMKIGMAAGQEFTRGDYRHRVVIGKDTRLSGYMLEPALTAGFISVGMDVILAGPLPTPAISMLTRSLRCDIGVMLTASHNPYADNGIKLFGPDGYKLSDDIEARIEDRLDNGLNEHLAPAEKLGRATRLEDVQGRYTEFVKATFPKGLSLEGLKIVVDCANGAAYRVAPTILWELGAEVVAIGNKPNGFNINQNCGSTDTSLMRQTVIEEKADLGIALDGDADRVIIADERGVEVDGDQLMAVIAASWQQSELLRGGGVVATVMSNLGLERHLQTLGLTLHRTQVGDRYVVEYMRSHGFNLGGEQSGHMVLGDYAMTGDGLMAALQILAELVRTGKTASEVCSVFTPLPQILRNVVFSGDSPLDLKAVKDAIAEGENRLATTGRLLIRKSGTEPKIRVMAEGEDKALVGTVVNDICTVIERAAQA